MTFVTDNCYAVIMSLKKAKLTSKHVKLMYRIFYLLEVLCKYNKSCNIHTVVMSSSNKIKSNIFCNYAHSIKIAFELKNFLRKTNLSGD